MRTASRTSWLGLRDLRFIPSPGELQRGLEDLAGLALDRTLRLAVTGLRQGGKTVFVTALVHHLLSGRELWRVRPSGGDAQLHASLPQECVWWEQPTMNDRATRLVCTVRRMDSDIWVGTSFDAEE